MLHLAQKVLNSQNNLAGQLLGTIGSNGLFVSIFGCMLVARVGVKRLLCISIDRFS